MEKKFICTDKACIKKHKEPYIKVIEVEGIMDEQNIAQMYCPRCKSPLIPCETTPEETC